MEHGLPRRASAESNGCIRNGQPPQLRLRQGKYAVPPASWQGKVLGNVDSAGWNPSIDLWGPAMFLNSLNASRHVDTFVRDNLPAPETWPTIYDIPGLQLPDELNCVEFLLDNAAAGPLSLRTAIRCSGKQWTYAELAGVTNQIAHVLVDELGVLAGNRVLLHGPNSPYLFATWLAIVKVGAVVVPTMPLLRARELRPIIEKANITLAISAHQCIAELEGLLDETPLRSVIALDDPKVGLQRIMASKPSTFYTVPTSRDDACLIAFTSGTTGEPKATVHFHRDILAMCACFAKHVLDANCESIFSGTPPIGFTYGLGALLIFPLYFGASVALPDAPTALGLVEAIQRFRVTHLFTAPTAYKQMHQLVSSHDVSSLRICVSAGEALSAAVSESWFNDTGVRIIDGIGSTEMMHIFISSRVDKVRPGATGKPIPGYRVTLFDDRGQPIDGPGVGRLAVQGPTGCRYLSDSRQQDYVIDGWNFTGDLYRRDREGFYWHVARVDDMIVSSGYNIAGPEVEAALMLHPDVQECAVIGWPDEERGQIVKAVVVPRRNVRAGSDFARVLQEHVRQTLAPYKYPRCVEFRENLPRTATGKLRRGALRAASIMHRQEATVGAVLQPRQADVRLH